MGLPQNAPQRARTGNGCSSEIFPSVDPGSRLGECFAFDAECQLKAYYTLALWVAGPLNDVEKTSTARILEHVTIDISPRPPLPSSFHIFTWTDSTFSLFSSLGPAVHDRWAGSGLASVSAWRYGVCMLSPVCLRPFLVWA